MNKNGKRLLSVLLCLVMVLGLLPASALAADRDGGESEPEQVIYTVPDVEATLHRQGILWREQHHVKHYSNLGIVSVTPVEFGENDITHSTTITVNHGVLVEEGYRRHMMVLEAQVLNRKTNTASSDTDDGDSKYCEVTVNWDGSIGILEVYLVDFGITKETEIVVGPNTYTCEKPTKGLKSITLNGSNIHVYLVNSNFGYIDYLNGGLSEYYSLGMGHSTNGTDYINSSAWEYYGDATILVNGIRNKICMDSRTNAKNPGNVYVRCGMNTEYADIENVSYAPYYDQFWYGIRRVEVEEMRSTVELANVTVKDLGPYTVTDKENNHVRITNRRLDNLSGASLYSCVWPKHNSEAEDRIYLEDLSQLALINCTFTLKDPDSGWVDAYPTVELCQRADLTLGGSVTARVECKGINEIRMKNADMKENIIIENENTALSDDWMSDADVEAILGNPDLGLTGNGMAGAQVTLLLSGSSVMHSAHPFVSYCPEIMVGNLATLTVNDDPAVAGVGAVSLGGEGEPGYPDLGSHWCTAALGGLPAYADPKPHGPIYIKGGVLSAYASYGAAAIGGSSQDPYICYLDEDPNEIDTVNSTLGFSRNGGSVCVYGGVVNATSLERGAAIGGAVGGNGGTFIILGGTVNAHAHGGGAAIGGGAVNWGTPTRQAIAFTDDPNAEGANWSALGRIYIDSYTYDPIMGGGSGKVYIYGGVVNASADNLAYDDFGDPVQYPAKLYDSKDGYSEVYKAQYDEFWYGPGNDHYQITWDDLFTFSTGRKAGYVIGSTCENANAYRENVTEISVVGGMITSDSHPMLVLSMNPSTAYASNPLPVSWNCFYREPNPDGVMTVDAMGRTDSSGHKDFSPSLVSDAALILTVGLEDNLETYAIRARMKDRRTYRLRGQINLPDVNYSEGIWELPMYTVLDMLPGTVLNVPEKLSIMAFDAEQLQLETGAVAQGKGQWPGKPTDPKNPPSYDAVKSMIRRMSEAAAASGENEEVTTHLGIGKVKLDGGGSGYAIISGNSAQAVQNKADGLGMSLATIISAGSIGFKKTVTTDDKGVESETWRLLSYDPNTVLTLVSNGALLASPDSYTTVNHRFDIILTETGGALTAKLQSAKLSSPDYTIYDPLQADDELNLIFSADGKMAVTVSFDADQIENNSAVISIPKFYGSEFSLKGVSALRDKCALRYSGVMNFYTPVMEVADITITELQLKYGDGIALDGINGGGTVSIPAIGGFPVSGKASMTINTFAPKRELSLNVELDTPIFEGAFEASFKEVKGYILPDTLYAELAVGEAGIPIVPPTVIGYIQGGGLGITHLADTINMDSFGAPPVRLKIAAKGSVMDAISGWLRLSVGLDGFSLDLTDAKVRDLEILKKIGWEVKWTGGEQKIGTRTYWGLGTEMYNYVVISVPVKALDNYGDVTDLNIALLSATGSVTNTGFVGYAHEGSYYHFIYRMTSKGTLSAEVNIPKKIIGGVLPLSNFKLGGIELGYYAAANLTSKFDSSVANGSPSSVLSQLAKKAKIDFDAAIGAQFTIGGGKYTPSAYVRIVYVLGKNFDIDGGLGSGGKLNLESYVNSPAANNEYAALVSVTDPQTGEVIPTIMEAGAERLASLEVPDVRYAAPALADAAMTQDPDAPLADVTLAPLPSELLGSGERKRGGDTPVSGFTSSVNNPNAIGNVIYAITLKNTGVTMTVDQLQVTLDGEPVALMEAEYDENGNQTPETEDANFFADAGIAYFAPIAVGTYTFRSTLEIESVDVVQMQPFAQLERDFCGIEAAPNGDTATVSYQMENEDPERRYKIQAVLGKTKGSGEYLMEETELSEGAACGMFTFELSGSLLPTGEYYPTILLLEYVAAADEQGNLVETWALIDEKAMDNTLHYENDVIPAAPDTAELAYSGNGTMTASWSAVTGADAYELTVYDAEGKNTGLLYQTGDDSTSMILDMSSLYEEDGVERSYSVGVRAVIYENELDKANSTYQEGYEAMTGLAVLRNPTPPTLTYSAEVELGEGNAHTVSVGPEGGSFTVTADKELDFVVVDTSDASGNPIAAAQNVRSLTVVIPDEPEDRAVNLRIVAMDPDTLDYALGYVAVHYDNVAPPLILDELGAYNLHYTELGFMAYITGYAEAGASVLLYCKENTRAAVYGNYVTGVVAGADGSFSIPVQFAEIPENEEYCVLAVDKVGNASEPMSVYFQPSSVTLNLDPNGEYAVCTSGAVGLTAGMAVGVLPEPFWSDSAGGWLFDGWYTEPTEGELVTASSVFTESATLYAHWARATSVSYNEDGSKISEVPVKLNQPLETLPDPRIEHEGQVFVGWFTAGGTQYTESTVITGKTNLTARWADAVTVTFDAGLGSCDVDELTIPVNSKLSAYPVPTATGYTFTGWYTVAADPMTGETVETDVLSSRTYSEDTCLVARWKRKTATLAVSQSGCTVGEELAEPVFTAPEGMVGSPTVTYSSATGFLSNLKPTAVGTYTVTVQCDTYELAYVGSATFAIAPEAGALRYAVSPATVTGGSIDADKAEAAAGETVTVTVNPEPGWELDAFTVTQEASAVSLVNNGDGTYTFTMPAGDVTLNASFTARTQFTVAAVTADQGGAEVSDIRISSPYGAVYYEGDEITLTAKSKSGYTFLGWFITDTETKVADTLAYTFILTEDVDLTARFEARENATLTVTTGNSAEYHFLGDNAVQTGSATRTVQLGTVITVVAEDTDSVLQWQNENGKVLGTGGTLKLAVTGNMTVTLVYRTARAGQAYLQFVSDFQQVLAYSQITAESDIIYPTPPGKFGFTFENWVLDGSETEATEEVITGLVGSQTIIIVGPKYEQIPEEHSVTVKYDGVIKDTEVYGGITLGSGYTVTAPVLEGYRFECWKNAEGTVLSYKESYYLQVSADVTLTACYVMEAEEVVALPVIIIDPLTTTEVSGVHKVTAAVTRSIPDGYTLVEHGILYARDFVSPTAENFVYGGASVSTYVSSSTAKSGVVRLNVKVETDSVAVTFRGYMILLNKTTGNQEIWYTDFLTGTYAELNP